MSSVSVSSSSSVSIVFDADSIVSAINQTKEALLDRVDNSADRIVDIINKNSKDVISSLDKISNKLTSLRDINAGISVLGTKIDNLSGNLSNKVQLVSDKLEVLGDINKSLSVLSNNMGNLSRGYYNNVVTEVTNIHNDLNAVFGSSVDTSSIDNFDYSYFDEISQLVENVKNDLSVIDEQYNNMIKTFENGFSPSSVTISRGCEPIFSVNLFGQDIQLKLCPAFSAFKPFFVFIITLVFFYLSAKILYIGIKYDR